MRETCSINNQTLADEMGDFFIRTQLQEQKLTGQWNNRLEPSIHAEKF